MVLYASSRAAIRAIRVRSLELQRTVSANILGRHLTNIVYVYVCVYMDMVTASCRGPFPARALNCQHCAAHG